MKNSFVVKTLRNNDETGLGLFLSLTLYWFQKHAAHNLSIPRCVICGQLGSNILVIQHGIVKMKSLHLNGRCSERKSQLTKDWKTEAQFMNCKIFQSFFCYLWKGPQGIRALLKLLIPYLSKDQNCVPGQQFLLSFFFLKVISLLSGPVDLSSSSDHKGTFGWNTFLDTIHRWPT